MQKYNAGFSLIELMIVVAIVGVISAFAYPSFQESAAAAKRSDAIAALQEIQINQASFRANNPNYANADELAEVWGNGTTSLQGHYTVAITAPTAASPSGITFTITATPVAGGDMASDRCGTFAMDESGKLTTGTYAGSAGKEGCW